MIWPIEKIAAYLPNGASEFVLITLQKSVMGCSANLFFQYKIYLKIKGEMISEEGKPQTV